MINRSKPATSKNISAKLMPIFSFFESLSQKVDFYKEYSVEIEAEGEIADLTTFLHQINISPQLLRVEKLRLNAKESENKILKSSMLITKVLVL